MKKLGILMLFVMILGIAQYASAQNAKTEKKHYPINRYNENGYSIAHLDTFLYQPTELSRDYKQKFLALINKALYASGEYANLPDGKQSLGESDIDWILSHTTTVVRKYQDFKNSYQSLDRKKVEYYFDKEKEPFMGPCFAFEYRSCRLVFAKLICLNLLDVGFEKRQYAEPPVYRPKPRPLAYRPTPMYVPTYIPTTIPVYKPKVKKFPTVLALIGVAVISGGAYELFHKGPTGIPGGAPSTTGGEIGGPGGAPSTPGGAPSTTGALRKFSAGFSVRF